MEAKYYRTNLLLWLERFKAHIEQFSKVKREGKSIRVFIFGNYDFYVLCMGNLELVDVILVYGTKYQVICLK